jgi:hypothetical protein
MHALDLEVTPIPLSVSRSILQVWLKNNLNMMFHSLLVPYTGFVLPHLHFPLSDTQRIPSFTRSVLRMNFCCLMPF